MATTIALTGGMGCGKSAAAQAFAELGAEVLDADKLAHAALENNPEVVAAVKRAVGERAYGADGKPDRAEIAKAVFSDAAKLAEIERAIHPAIEREWRAAAEKLPDGKIAVVEVPLLFEKKLEKKFDFCITVFCSEPLRKFRLSNRGMSDEQIARRDAFQMPPEQKSKLADIVLFNESDTAFLKRQAELVLSRLNKNP